MNRREVLGRLREGLRGAAEDVLAYLEQHPRAADTVPGIARFWVRGCYDDEEIENVLDRLVELDALARWQQPDGRNIFGLPRRTREHRS